MREIDPAEGEHHAAHARLAELGQLLVRHLGGGADDEGALDHARDALRGLRRVRSRPRRPPRLHRHRHLGRVERLGMRASRVGARGRRIGDRARLLLAVGEVDRPRHGTVVEDPIDGLLALACLPHCVREEGDALTRPSQLQAGQEDRVAPRRRPQQRFVRERGEHDRRVRPLDRRGPHAVDVHLEMLALEGAEVAAPGALHQLDGLEHSLALALRAGAEARVLELVEGGAPPDPDGEPAAQQVVECRGLDQDPRRMVEGHLQHGEADPDARRALRERRTEDQRVAVDALTGEVVLRQPRRVETEPLGLDDLLDLLRHDAVVVVRRRRVR